MASEKASLFEYVHDRSGEPLVQGLLRFALERDEAFRSEFCRWAGWSAPYTRFREEAPDGEHRHDIVAYKADAETKRIELKLWSGWTVSQRTDPGSIDLVILPESRKREVHEQFPPSGVRTWEDLMMNVVPKGQIAQTLLDGLLAYIRAGNEVEVAALREEISRPNLGASSGGGPFLTHCCRNAEELGLVCSASTRRSSPQGYWGRYLTNLNIRDDGNYMWLGFVFDMNPRLEDQRLAFVLFAVWESLADRLGLTSQAAAWYKWDRCRRGIEFQPLGGVYTIRDWWAAASPVLERFAGLT